MYTERMIVMKFQNQEQTGMRQLAFLQLRSDRGKHA